MRPVQKTLCHPIYGLFVFCFYAYFVSVSPCNGQVSLGHCLHQGRPARLVPRRQPRATCLNQVPNPPPPPEPEIQVRSDSVETFTRGGAGVTSTRNYSTTEVYSSVIIVAIDHVPSPRRTAYNAETGRRTHTHTRRLTPAAEGLFFYHRALHKPATFICMLLRRLGGGGGGL